MKCANCNKPHNNEARFCPHCGSMIVAQGTSIDLVSTIPEEVSISEDSQTYDNEILENHKASGGSNETLATIGAIFWMIAPVVFMIFLILAALKGQGFLLNYVVVPLYFASMLLFFVTLFILLPLSLFKVTRNFAGATILVGSYIYGTSAWIIGFYSTLYYWGVFAVIIGLFFAGVGVVPIGLLAAFLHGSWDAVWNLIILMALTYGTRLLSIWILERD